MAPQEHRFSKLRLDTPVTPKRVSSTFASLKREDGDAPTPHQVYVAEHSIPASAPHLPFSSSAVLSNDDLVLAHSPFDEDLSNRLRAGIDLDSGTSLRSELSEEDVAVSSPASSSEVDSLEAGLRTRGMSVSFAREVTTEDGDKQLLDEPLPRSAPRAVPFPIPYGNNKSRHREREDGEESEAATPPLDMLDTRNDQPRSSYRENGDSRLAPTLLHAHTRPEGPQITDEETTTSLTSSTTASPPIEELLTPLDPDLLSPTHKVTSPIEFPSGQRTPGWPPLRSDSARSRSYNRISSLVGSGGGRPTERRRSTRSATGSMSSMSPASAFLSQWGRQAVEETVEPDDEGQEIGDHSGWIIGRKIGYGGFSTVKEVYTMENDKKLVRAVKIVRKQPPSIRDEVQNERVQQEFEHEVSIWRYFRHRYILPLIAVHDTPFATFCITKLNVGGTLHDLLRSRRQMYGSGERGLSANLAKRYTYQLAAAIRYLHEDVRVVHRDIKLENCLLDMSAPDAKQEGGNILLCDFGMADFVHNESRADSQSSHDGAREGRGKVKYVPHNIGPAETSSNLSTYAHNQHYTGAATLDSRETTLSIMGSLEYAAPELITSTTTLFSPAADIWAFGVVVYALLTGNLPFSHAMREKLVVMIEKTQWDVAPLYGTPAVTGSGIAGMGAIELIQGCLTHDADDRWDIQRILSCRWLRGCKEFYGDGCDVDEDEDGKVGGGWR
jgi:serine/threonine protein kinase